MDRYGNNTPVSFRATGGDGISVSYSANPTTASSGSITFTASPTAKIATQNMTIIATQGNVVNAQTFEIYVSKAPAASLAFSSSSLAYNATAGGAAQLKSVSLRNSGTTAVTVNSLSLSGAGASAYSLNASACNGKSLAAGASCNVDVTLNPSTAGSFNAQVNVSSALSSNPTLALSATVAGAPDFSLSAPSSVSLNQSGSASAAINLSRTNFTSPVVLTVSGLPSGVNANFANNNITGNSTTLNFTASSDAATGPATITVEAVGGSITRSANFSLNVQASSYSLSASPVSITQGQSGTSTISIARSNFSSAVNLSATFPAGISGSISPTSTTGNSASLNLSVASSVQAGNYTVQVASSGGSLSRTVDVGVTVVAAPADFSITATPASVSMSQTGSAAVTFNLSRNNFTDPIQLTTISLPNGVSGSYVNNNTTGNSATLNLSAASDATVGTSTVTVQAVSGLYIHTATFGLTVTALPGYNLSLSPAGLNLSQGASATSSLSIARTNFTNSINLSVINSPANIAAGFTASITPASTTGNSATVSVNAAANTTPGSYGITVQAVSGATTKTVSLTTNVSAAAPNFTMSVAPAALNVKQGASGNFSVNLVRTNLTDNITPSLTGLPEGVTGSCAMTGGSSSACTLTAAQDATVGLANVNIQASAGSITRTASLALTISASSVGGIAFPGALGFGSVATGGRAENSTVCYVKNLNGSGAGSLQDCVDKPGPKYILFQVSGTINSDIHLKGKDYTIFGNRPIIVRGVKTDEMGQGWCDQDPNCLAATIRTENIIVRNFATRDPLDADGFRVRAAKKVMMDHISIGNAEDEAVEISFSSDVTLQNVLLAETLGGHSVFGGILINYSEPLANLILTNISIVQSSWNRLEGRFPEFSRESPRAHQYPLDAELINNLMWDAGYFSDISEVNPMSGQKLNYHMNWIGNHFFVRPTYPYGMYDMHMGFSDNRDTHFHLRDNTMNLYTDRADQGLIYCCNDFQDTEANMTKPAWFEDQPNVFTSPQPSRIYDSRTELRQFIYENVGAFPRNPMDVRLMNPVCTGQFPKDAQGNYIARNVNPANDGLIPAAAPALQVDTDQDGMPDAWETAHGLNPNVQDHNGYNLSGDYPNIEVWINEQMDSFVANESSVNSANCNF